MTNEAVLAIKHSKNLLTASLDQNESMAEKSVAGLSIIFQSMMSKLVRLDSITTSQEKEEMGMVIHLILSSVAVIKEAFEQDQQYRILIAVPKEYKHE